MKQTIKKLFCLFESKPGSKRNKTELKHELVSVDEKILAPFKWKLSTLPLMAVCFLFIFSSGVRVLGNQPAGQVVKGIVSDAASAASLPGVNVLVKGTSVGTVTDPDGKYSLQIIDPKCELVFSFVGYKTLIVPLNNREVVNVSMEEEVKGLEDVVVVGYGVQKKSDLTGVISSIKAKDIQKLAVATVDQALQGQASGVYVTRKSGAPGDGAKIFVRGQGSINNTDPIWIVDGIRSSAGANFNLNDIESIEILKDASAAAIYGVEAANGVILVTTKKGKKGDPKVSLSAYYGQNSPVKLPQMLNTQEFAQVKNQAFDAEKKARIPRIADMNNLPKTSTDWFDEIFNPAPLENVDLSISGGTEKMNFYISGNFYNEKGTMINTGYQRINLSANSEFRVSSKLKIGETLTLNRSLYTSFFNPEDVYQKSNMLDFVRGIPTMPVYDVTNTLDGFGYADPIIDAYQGTNPLQPLAQNEFNTRNHGIKANVYLDWEIIPDLHFKVVGGGNINFIKNDLYRAPYFYGTHMSDPVAEMRLSYKENYELTGNAVLNYSKTFNLHSFNVMIGTESQKTDWNYFWAGGKDFGGLRVLSAGKKENQTNGGIDGLERVLSQFGRINYIYAGKYMFTANIRRDGSSKFGSLSRWGIFPSFSGGWNIHKENFMASVTSVSALKLTLGWGKLGSDRIPAFLSNEYYTNTLMPLYYVFGNPQSLAEGYAIKQFPNKSAKWEEIKQFDAGIQLSLFDNQLEFTSNYYRKNTSDMLIAVTLPPSAGFTYGYDAGDESDASVDPSINIGEIKNEGIEFSFTARKKINDFSAEVTGNVSYNVNEVVNLNKDQVIASGDMTLRGTTKVSRIQAGYPIAYYYGYKVEGIIQSQEELDALNQNARQKALEAELAKNPGSTKTINDFSKVYYQYKNTAPGDLMWKDIAGRDANNNIVMTPDGKIDEADKTNIGNPWPKWIFGININLKWKAFDLSIFGQGVQGRDVFNSFKYYTENVAGDGNYSKSILDAWTPDNHDTNIPRLTLADSNKNAATVSSRYVEDGSYFRLKNVQLGFTLPSTASAKIGISKLRLYLSGQNLLTFTGYSGLDPEFSVNEDANNTSVGIDRGYYPLNKSVLFGVQVDF